ncbi:MAG: hypothetical protein WCE21_02600 [Candidatus Babeliales bacterium]
MLFALLLLSLLSGTMHAMEENTPLLHNNNQDTVLTINTSNSIGINGTSAWDILNTLENNNGVQSIELKGKAYNTIVDDFLTRNKWRIFSYEDKDEDLKCFPLPSYYQKLVEKNIDTFISQKNISSHLQNQIADQLKTEPRIRTQAKKDARRHTIGQCVMLGCSVVFTASCALIIAFVPRDNQ